MLRKFLVSIYAFWCVSGQAQNTNSSTLDRDIFVEFNNVSLNTALRQLNRQAKVNFSYNSTIIPKTEKITAVYNGVPLRTILDDLLGEANLFYKEVNGTVIILKRIFTDRQIMGKVVDAKTESPLPFANVFIDNSTFGVATDEYGTFEIKNIPDIAFNLVVSYVGYESKTINFNYKDSIDSRRLLIELEIEETDLDPIEVTAKMTRKERRKDKRIYKRFEDDFLGRDDNAKDCKIVNPDVLDYELIDSLGNYRVTATDILFIENYAMGYRIGCLLDEFTFVNGVKTMIGTTQFKELEAGSRRQNRKWDEARESAYLGSSKHFLNSLIENTLREQGFLVNIVQFDSVTSEYSTPLNPPPVSELLKLERTDKDYQYRLIPATDIEVTYTKEFEDADYIKLFRSKSKTGNYKYTDQKSRSTITLSNDQSLSSYQVVGTDISDVPLFQKSVILFQTEQPLVNFPGYFSSKRAVNYLGWWTWGGLSVELPLNYVPNK